MTEKMTYAGVGVDYEAMDPFKRLAQAAGRETAKNILRLDFSEVEMSRGESAYLMEAGDHYVAHLACSLCKLALLSPARLRESSSTRWALSILVKRWGFVDKTTGFYLLTFFTDNLLCIYEG